MKQINRDVGFLPRQRKQMFPCYFFLRVEKERKKQIFFFIAKNLKLFSESIKNMQMFVKAEIFCSL